MMSPSQKDKVVKNYILDTNVLLHDPNSLMSFRENNVLIPIEVIEEIDKFKRESTDLGQNARTVSRTLDELRSKGRLSEGVKLPNNGCLKVVFVNNGSPTLVKENADNRILALALQLKKEKPEIPTIIVSKD
ncbi:MAG: PIN domain-containing protein, partial [Limisphaerales bacterium]